VHLIGITGGVGMGKSTAQSLLEGRGVPVIDTDQLARQLVAPGQPALAEVIGEFGQTFLEGDESLNREKLADLVFKDPQARQRLESILHPRIRAAWLQDVQQWRKAGVVIGAVVIPLLHETGAADSFDVTACVACSPEIQLERLKTRGWSEAQIRGRLEAQWPLERKVAASDVVIWTDGDLEVHSSQWVQLLNRLQK
jgi:dephospho-CoA kinase